MAADEFGQVLLKGECTSESPGGLLECRFLSPSSRVSDSVGPCGMDPNNWRF